MNRKKIIIIGISVLILLTLLYFFFGRKKEETVAFETGIPEKGHIPAIITSTGTIQPVDTVAVGTQVSGIIASIYTDYNAQVKKGQLLAELHRRRLPDDGPGKPGCFRPLYGKSGGAQSPRPQREL